MKNPWVGILIATIAITVIIGVAAAIPFGLLTQVFPANSPFSGFFTSIGVVATVVPLLVIIIFGIALVPFIRMATGGAAGRIKNGVPAPAKIIEVQETGMTVNQNPMVGFVLEVRPAGAAPYQASTRAMVSRLQVGYLLPGTPVQVVYDPSKPERVEITQIDASATARASAATAGGPAAALEQLAALHGKGLITDEEFQQKRAEVLRTI